MLRNNKGVTLIALAITIVILLILASIGIISGTSTVQNVKFNNAKSQFEIVQSEVYTWNKDEMKNYGQSITGNSKAQQTLTATGEANSGYKYFSADYLKDELDIEGVKNDFLINVNNRKVLLVGGITYQDKTYYTAIE